jgi:PAS domain S-box-containing protein
LDSFLQHPSGEASIMRWRRWGVVTAALVGFLLTATTCSSYLWGRHAATFFERGGKAGSLVLLTGWLQGGGLGLVLASGLAGALAGIILGDWRERYWRQVVHQLEERLHALRRNPVPHALGGSLLSGPPLPAELTGVVKQLEMLGKAYRKAVQQVVTIQEEAEALRSELGLRGPRSGGAGSGRTRKPTKEDGDSLIRFRPSSSILTQSARHRMVARLAPNLHIMALTLPLQRFLGRTSAELIARPFLDLVHAGDVPEFRRALENALEEGEGHNILIRVRVAQPEPPAPPSPGGPGGVPPPRVPAAVGPGGTPEGPSRGRPGGTQPEATSRTIPGTGSLTAIPGRLPETASSRDRYLQVDVLTTYNEQGEPLHLRCHFTDVTERVLTERELLRRTHEVTEANTRLRKINDDLQRLKESYRDLYHNAPILYFSLDQSGVLVAFNDTMLRTLGYPREALLGKPYTLLLPPDERAYFLADPSVLQRPGDLETRWVKQDGTVFDVWIGTTIICDSQRGFLRSRNAALDVTERNLLDNELQRKADDLARANLSLQRINRELEEFTYVVSHDLKEPLRTLLAFSTFLSEDHGPTLGEEGQDYLHHLIQASRRLSSLIDDLLTLSRAGRVMNTPRPFSWDQVIATVRSDLHDLIQRKQAVVRVEAPLPAAMGDSDRIIQLLTNLVSNALKYNPNPDPEVVIGSRPTEESGERRAASGERRQDARAERSEEQERDTAAGASGFVTRHSPLASSSGGSDRHRRASQGEGEPGPRLVTLFVRDNGSGIDPVYHEQIFRIFRRLHRRDEVEGTGAGLAICKKVVEAHGGRIWVESQPGQGSTFLFTLPQQVEEPTSQRDSQAGDNPP